MSPARAAGQPAAGKAGATKKATAPRKKAGSGAPAGGDRKAGAVTGVVVMAYGTPDGPDGVAEFYTDVRRGSPPSAEQLADLQRRYEAIGGVSPLAERTRAQVAGIQRALDAIAPGAFRAVLGTKHSKPSIEDAVDELAGGGVTAAIGLVLAPHYSALSVGEYAKRIEARGESAGIRTTMIESWHDLPVLQELLAQRVLRAMDDLNRRASARPAHAGRLEVLFTAHSLPVRILDTGDPYPRQLDETAVAVAELTGVTHWRTAWQSAGRTSEPWLGPDLLEVLRSLPGEGVDRVVVCPAGFTSDHLEVLYDVDVEARQVAENNWLDLERTESLNDDPELCEGLARLVVDAAAGLAGGSRAPRSRGA